MTIKEKIRANAQLEMEFVKKTSMPIENLGYIKWYDFNSPRCIKSSRNFIRYNCYRICSWSKRPETLSETRKKAIFLKLINKPIIKFFKDFTNHSKKIKWAIV